MRVARTGCVDAANPSHQQQTQTRGQQSKRKRNKKLRQWREASQLNGYQWLNRAPGFTAWALPVLLHHAETTLRTAVA